MIYNHEYNDTEVRGNFYDVSLSCQMPRRIQPHAEVLHCHVRLCGQAPHRSQASMHLNCRTRSKVSERRPFRANPALKTIGTGQNLRRQLHFKFGVRSTYKLFRVRMPIIRSPSKVNVT